jgi:hypothetical protein
VLVLEDDVLKDDVLEDEILDDVLEDEILDEAGSTALVLNKFAVSGF